MKVCWIPSTSISSPFFSRLFLLFIFMFAMLLTPSFSQTASSSFSSSSSSSSSLVLSSSSPFSSFTSSLSPHQPPFFSVSPSIYPFILFIPASSTNPSIYPSDRHCSILYFVFIHYQRKFHYRNLTYIFSIQIFDENTNRKLLQHNYYPLQHHRSQHHQHHRHHHHRCCHHHSSHRILLWIPLEIDKNENPPTFTHFKTAEINKEMISMKRAITTTINAVILITTILVINKKIFKSTKQVKKRLTMDKMEVPKSTIRAFFARSSVSRSHHHHFFHYHKLARYHQKDFFYTFFRPIVTHDKKHSSNVSRLYTNMLSNRPLFLHRVSQAMCSSQLDQHYLMFKQRTDHQHSNCQLLFFFDTSHSANEYNLTTPATSLCHPRRLHLLHFIYSRQNFYCRKYRKNNVKNKLKFLAKKVVFNMHSVGKYTTTDGNNLSRSLQYSTQNNIPNLLKFSPTKSTKRLFIDLLNRNHKKFKFSINPTNSLLKTLYNKLRILVNDTKCVLAVGSRDKLFKGYNKHPYGFFHIFFFIIFFVSSSASSLSPSILSKSSSSTSSLLLHSTYRHKRQQQIQCPSNCFCNTQNHMVHCSRKDLTHIPFNIHSSTLQLNLNNNHFRYHTLHPDNFTSLIHLQFLYLDDCAIEFIHPSTFSSLRSLTHLDLSNNRLKLLASGTFNNLNLQHLFLKGNKQLQLPHDVFQNLSVKGLHLQECSLQDIDYRLFIPLQPKLKILWLNGNQITRFEKSLKPIFQQLSYLRINDNPFHCSCKTLWLKEFYDSKANVLFKETLTPTCLSPPNFKGKTFAEFTVSQLKCQLPVFLNHEVSFSSFGGFFKCIAMGNPPPTLTWLDGLGRKIKEVTPIDASSKTVEADLEIVLEGCSQNDKTWGDSNETNDEKNSKITNGKSKAEREIILNKDGKVFVKSICSHEKVNKSGKNTKKQDSTFQCMAENSLGNVSLNINVTWPKTPKSFNIGKSQKDAKNYLENENYVDFNYDFANSDKKLSSDNSFNSSHANEYTFQDDVRLYSVLEMILAVLITFVITGLIAAIFAYFYWVKFRQNHKKKIEQKCLPPHPFMLSTPSQANNHHQAQFNHPNTLPATTNPSHTTIQPLITPLEASSSYGSHLYAETSSSIFPMPSDHPSNNLTFQPTLPHLPPNHPLLSNLNINAFNQLPSEQISKKHPNHKQNHSSLNQSHQFSPNFNSSQKFFTKPHKFRSTWVNSHSSSAYPPSVLCDPKQYQIQRSDLGCFTNKTHKAANNHTLTNNCENNKSHNDFPTRNKSVEEMADYENTFKGSNSNDQMNFISNLNSRENTSFEENSTSETNKNAEKIMNNSNSHDLTAHRGNGNNQKKISFHKCNHDSTNNNKGFNGSNLSSSLSSHSSSSSSPSSSYKKKQNKLKQLQKQQKVLESQQQKLLLHQLLQQNSSVQPRNFPYDVIDKQVFKQIEWPNQVIHQNENKNYLEYSNYINNYNKCDQSPNSTPQPGHLGYQVDDHLDKIYL